MKKSKQLHNKDRVTEKYRGGTLKGLLLRTTLRLKNHGKVLQKSPKVTSEQNSNLAPS